MDYKATESAVIADERRTMKYRTCSCDVASCDMSRVADVDLVVMTTVDSCLAVCHAVAPEIVMPNRRIWQSVGRETILECTITALPQAISYWQKNGRRITNTIHPSLVTAAGRRHGGDDADVRHLMARPSGVVKYRIEAYDEGDHTLTLNLRLQVRNNSLISIIVIIIIRLYII